MGIKKNAENTGNAVHITELCEIGDRERQEDSRGYGGSGEYAYAVLADGIGGMEQGEASSGFLVNFASEWLAASKADADTEICNGLYDMIQSANDKLRAHMAKQDGLNSGSTLLAVSIRQNRLFWVSAGDSRIYLLRGGRLFCLTRDHVRLLDNLRKAADGEISFEDACADPMAKALTCYMGAVRLLDVDRNIKPLILLPGDKVMLCSDGVYGALTEDEMIKALTQNREEAVRAIKTGVLAARLPHQDNFTALVISVPPASHFAGICKRK